MLKLLFVGVVASEVVEGSATILAKHIITSVAHSDWVTVTNLQDGELLGSAQVTEDTSAFTTMMLCGDEVKEKKERYCRQMNKITKGARYGGLTSMVWIEVRYIESLLCRKQEANFGS